MDQFDDIIKQKLGEEEFPFDENNWEKASALIDADRKSKKRRAFILWIFGGILILGGTTFLLLFPSKTNEYAQNQTAQGNQKNNVSEIVKKNKIDKSFVEPDNTGNRNNSQSYEQKNNTVSRTQASSTISRTNYSIKKHKPSGNDQKNKGSVSSLPAPINLPSSTTITNNAQVNEAANKGIDSSILKTILVNTDSIKDSIAVVATGSLKQDSLPETATTDSIPEIIPKKNSLEIVMGTAWSTPWTTNVKKFGFGLSPIVGISYERKIKSHYGVSVGLQLNTFYNKSNLPFVSQTTSYGFGKTTYVHTTHVNYLQYISMPVRFVYPANKKGNFSFGVNIGYLIDSRIERELYAARDLDGSSVITTFDNGVYKGFHSVDAQLAIAYRRKMPNRFSLQLECFYGLTDIFDNDIVGVNSFERNKGIKFTLGYELFRK